MQKLLNGFWFLFLQTNTAITFRWWHMSVTKSLLGTRIGLFLTHTLQVEWCLFTCSIIPWKRYEAAPHATSWLDRVLLKAPETTVYGSQQLQRALKIKAQNSNHYWSSFLLRKSTWWFCGYVCYSLLKAKCEYSSSSVKNIQVNDKTIKHPTHYCARGQIMHPVPSCRESLKMQNLTLMSSQHPCEVDRYITTFSEWEHETKKRWIDLSEAAQQIWKQNLGHGHRSLHCNTLPSRPTSSPGLNNQHPCTPGPTIHLVQQKSFHRLFLLQKWHEQILQNTFIMGPEFQTTRDNFHCYQPTQALLSGLYYIIYKAFGQSLSHALSPLQNSRVNNVHQGLSENSRSFHHRYEVLWFTSHFQAVTNKVLFGTWNHIYPGPRDGKSPVPARTTVQETQRQP